MKIPYANELGKGENVHSDPYTCSLSSAVLQGCSHSAGAERCRSSEEMRSVCVGVGSGYMLWGISAHRLQWPFQPICVSLCVWEISYPPEQIKETLVSHGSVSMS